MSRKGRIRKRSPHSTNKEHAQVADMAAEEMTRQYIIATVIAHFRGGQLSLESAARAIGATPDNFRRCCNVLDNEARIMLKSMEPAKPKAPDPAPPAETPEAPKEYPPLAVVPTPEETPCPDSPTPASSTASATPE